MGPLLELKDLTEPRALEALGRLGASTPEARRLWSAAVRRRARMADLPKLEQIRRPVLEAVLRTCRADRLEILERRTDPQDGFTKYVLGLPDGLRVEAVRIPIFETHYVVCVSSQVGCALGCAFCATGRMGFSRSLAAWEIVDQVLAIREEADRPVRGVVFMGMGEPLLNYEAVVDAAGILSASAGAAIGKKRISLSTVGWVPGMRRYTREGHGYRLAVSLTAAIPEKRAALVPVERRWPLTEVMAAARDHALARRTRVLLAYVMISGLNTGLEDARALAGLVGDTPVIVDLIDVNDATGRFRPPDAAELARFRDHLQLLGQPVVRRYSGGKNVGGACGMLAGDPVLAPAPGV